MSDGKPVNDPSMDDILASIRKIISDDEARAAAPRPAPAAARPSGDAAGDDVLLLTNLIEDSPGTASKPAPRPAQDVKPPVSPSSPGIAPIPSPPKSTVLDVEASPVRSDAASPPQPPLGVIPPMPQPTSRATGSDISASMARLRGAAVGREADPEIPPAPSGGGKTVEDLVREMLRPVLREWMDKNLPDMVEKLVEREVQRMTRR